MYKQRALHERKKIFAELVAIQDTNSMSTSQSRLAVRQHYGITDEALRRIEDEGIEKDWPPLEKESP